MTTEETLTPGQAEVAQLEHGAGRVDHHVGRLHVAVGDVGVLVEIAQPPDGVGHQAGGYRGEMGKRPQGTRSRPERPGLMFVDCRQPSVLS